MSGLRLRMPSKGVLGILVALVMTASVGMVTFFVTNNHVSPALRTQASKPPSIATIMSSLNTSLLGAYPYFHPVAPIAQTTTGYAVPGHDFQVALPVATDSVAYTDSRSNSEQTTYHDLRVAVPRINSYLLNHGFTMLSAADQSSSLLTTVYFYHRVDAVCQVTVYTQLAVTCTPIAQLAKVATQAQPLVDAYTSAAPKAGADVITTPNIRPSKTTGYTIATMAIYNDRGETSANFYNTNGSAWQIVDLSWYNDPHEDGDIIPNCADFESVGIVRQAFLGQACYDSATRMMRTV